MSRAGFRWAIVLGLGFLASTGARALAAEGARPPNVVIVFTDDEY